MHDGIYGFMFITYNNWGIRGLPLKYRGGDYDPPYGVQCSVFKIVKKHSKPIDFTMLIHYNGI